VLAYTLRRLLGAIPVILLVTLIVFVLNALIPGDPGRLRLGQKADPSRVESWNYQRGYRAPFVQQYLRYLGVLPKREYLAAGDADLGPEFSARFAELSGSGAPRAEWEPFAREHRLSVDEHGGQVLLYRSRFAGILQGELGESDQRQGMPVAERLRGAFEVTVKLACGSIVIAVLLGVSAGIVSAVKSRTFFDYASMLVAIVGVSMPVFWLGILMFIYVAPALGLPPTGLDRSSWLAEARSLVLPCTALGLISSATIARLSRSAMLDVLTQDYVRTARAKGLPQGAVILRHALRNAAIPIVTVVGNSFGYLLVGAVLTESVFALPGLGRTIVDSIIQRDRMVITGGILLMSIVFVVVNLLVDLSYGLFDPRVRHGRG